MMKKSYFMMALLAMGLTVASCNNDNDSSNSVSMPEGIADITVDLDEPDVTSTNIDNWMKYAKQVALLLKQDSQNLYDDWNSADYNGNGPYKDQFVNHTAANYKEAVNCVEQIVDGCIKISDEVGVTKIGDPRNNWENAKYKDAILGVESWYSFHSIDDYANNIRSIQNAFNGTLNGTEATHSLATYLKAKDNAVYTSTKAAITSAITAIQSMAAPFRSHIGNNSVPVAMTACGNLNTILSNQVKPIITKNNEDAELQNIVVTYVNDVLLPTYKELAEKNNALYDAIVALDADRTDANFEKAAEAWMNSRKPWETSEAFLHFGPVEDEGLDPNMDSWPLDQDAITNILKSGDLSALTELDEDGNITEAAQNVRGFHTLEFLIFKNGKARTYSK